jgi:hypothetical protein
MVLGYSLTEYARELEGTPQAVFNLRKCGVATKYAAVIGAFVMF